MARRFLPLVIEVAGYVLVSAAAFLTDVRLGIAVVGLVALRESRWLRPKLAAAATVEPLSGSDATSTP